MCWFGILHSEYNIWNVHTTLSEKLPHDENSAREGVNNKLLSTLITVVKVPSSQPPCLALNLCLAKNGGGKKKS